MRKANGIPTWAVVAVLGVAVLATLACNGQKSTSPTQPAARNYESPETTFVAAAFTATQVPGTRTVLFTDNSTGNITKRLWDFGDGTKSTAQNPIHKYRRFDTYIVTLTVANTISNDTVIALIVVVAEAEPPIEPPIEPPVDPLD